jgi:acetyl-CoA carboxylase biotin carboxyl carrier protein
MNKLKKLIEMVRASGIAELEIEGADEKIRIANAIQTPQAIYMNAPSQHSAPYISQPPATSPAASPTTLVASEPIPDTRKLIKSPMVGTFYRAASPGAKPLAEVGMTVKKGQTVCIIEAMKLMNEIESEFDGVIKEILVTNDMPIEYGEPLFVIE